MARGNDAAAARRDLDSQYGADHQSAEDLIRAHDETLDPIRIAAQNKAIDAEATEALSVPSPRFGGEVVSYAIRGGVLLVVEDVDGRYVKWHDDEAVKSGAKKASARGHALQGARGEGVASAQPDQTKARALPSEHPERTGAHQPMSQHEHDAGAPGAQFAGHDPSIGAPAQVAPEEVKVTDIKAELDKLGVQVPAETRKKDDLWALLPGDSQDKLKGNA